MSTDAGVTAATGERAPWSTARLVAFRFFFCYWVLYLLPTATSFLPFFSDTGDTFFRRWLPLVNWVGTHVLNIGYPITVLPAGSGDTTFDYVILLCYAIIAVVATVAWSVLDRKRREHERLSRVLRVALRYSLGIIMLSYGGAKLIPTQFGRVSVDRLLEPYGESSPMGLLWTFMAFSPAYTAFAGMGEVVGGLLVFFRRTTTLGALVCIGVMSNVVMMNFSYDVPVKLFSSHLLAMAVVLVLPDARRLADLFVFNRPVAPADLPAHALSPAWKWTRRAVKTALVGYALVMPLSQAWGFMKQFGAPRPYAIAGTYEVESFVRNRVEVPALPAEAQRWKRVTLGTRFPVRMMTDSVRWYVMERDTVKAELRIRLWAVRAAGGDTVTQHVLKYESPDSTRLRLRGVLWGDTLDVRLRRADRSSFLLVKRGFHWINEFPFNR